MKSKKCKSNGCTNPVWAGGLCKNHISKPPLKSKSVLKARTSIKKKSDVVSMIDRMKPMQHRTNMRMARYNLFILIWKQRGNKSEVSGEKIYGEPSSAHFHHILPKSKYPEADLDKENIIIMTMDEHANVENDMYKYVEVNLRRVNLLKKYDLI